MLASATHFLAARSKSTTIIARNPLELAQKLGVCGVVADWERKHKIAAALELLPKFDLVLSWLHARGQWLAPSLEDKLVENGRAIRVHGSRVKMPTVLPFGARTDIIRQNIILGWINGVSGRRWLTNEEISQGVMGVILDATQFKTIVGTCDD